MLSGFTDSGSTIGQLSDHFFSSLKHELVLRF
ncbi:MAG: PAC2 family protein, partial [Aquiluna sp.]